MVFFRALDFVLGPVLDTKKIAMVTVKLHARSRTIDIVARFIGSMFSYSGSDVISTLSGPHGYRSVWRLSRLLIMWELVCSNERPPSGNDLVGDGKSHRITVSPCSCLLPALLEGHNPSMGVKYMPLRVPALWPSIFLSHKGKY